MKALVYNGPRDVNMLEVSDAKLSTQLALSNSIQLFPLFSSSTTFTNLKSKHHIKSISNK